MWFQTMCPLAKRKQQEKHQKQEQKRNTKASALTPDALRSYPGLENLSKARADEIIKSLEAFAQLTFNQFTKTYGQP